MPNQGGCLPAPTSPYPFSVTHTSSRNFHIVSTGWFWFPSHPPLSLSAPSKCLRIPPLPWGWVTVPRLRSHPSVTGRAVLERKASVVAEQGA
ncbi:hypothetical protein H8957_013647 [Semnopithecus entellus]